MSRNRDGGRLPARPTLTPVFVCAVVFWAACAVAYSTGDVRSTEASDAIVMAATALFIGSLGATSQARMRTAGVLLAAAAAGLMLGGAQAASIHAGAEAFSGLPDERMELVVLEDSEDFGYGENALVSGAPGGADPFVFEARFGDCGALLAGERVLVDASFGEIDFASDGFAWRDGACAALKATVLGKGRAPAPMAALIGFRAAAIEGIGAQDEGHALLQALVCGYRRNFRDSALYTDFQTCGLAHLVAVSGAHLVIVTGLFASLLKRLRIPRRAAIAVLVTAMASYYVISGMPVSALRAAVMSSLGLLAYFGKRRPSSLNAMGAGLFAIIVHSPPSCVSASLTLSALSTIGIVLFAPLMQAWLVQTPLARASFAVDALALTLASSVLSQLYACSLFNQLPLIAPVANVVTAPLFPFVCGSGLAAAVLQAGLAGLAPPVGEASAGLAAILACAVSSLAEVPFASVPFTVDSQTGLALSAALAGALWALWPRPDGRNALVGAAAATVLAAALFLSGDGGERIVMLDVGQGDAILVQSRGRSLLVDTGNQDSKLLRALAQNRVTHLDSVLVTHADDDHCGSLDQLERNVDVDRVIVASGMASCQGDSAKALIAQAGRTARELACVEAGDSFEVGSFTANVLWPREFVEDGGNADSLCLLLEYDGDGDGSVDFKVLMTGDAEKEELADMIEHGSVGDVDILKVGHHGSRNGMTPDEARTLDPEIALISCGAHNRYGHPTQEVLDMLDDVGAATFRTDLDGSITCDFSSNKLSVRCEQRNDN